MLLTNNLATTVILSQPAEKLAQAILHQNIFSMLPPRANPILITSQQTQIFPSAIAVRRIPSRMYPFLPAFVTTCFHARCQN
jgi:hypothetical protein